MRLVTSFSQLKSPLSHIRPYRGAGVGLYVRNHWRRVKCEVRTLCVSVLCIPVWDMIWYDACENACVHERLDSKTPHIVKQNACVSDPAKRMRERPRDPQNRYMKAWKLPSPGVFPFDFSALLSTSPAKYVGETVAVCMHPVREKPTTVTTSTITTTTTDKNLVFTSSTFSFWGKSRKKCWRFPSDACFQKTPHMKWQTNQLIDKSFTKLRSDAPCDAHS